MLDAILLISAVLLTIGTAIFVAAEFSLVALDPAALEARAEEDPRVANVSKRLHHLSLFLSACQVGITVTTILLGYVAQRPLTDIFSRWLGSAGMAKTAAVAVAATLAFILMNLFSMLFGELVPKNMALSDPLKTASMVGGSLHVFSILFKPIIVSFNGTANWFLRKIGIEPADEISGARSAPELGALVRQSAQAGTLEESTAELLTASIGVGNLTAVDVMTDRGRVAYLPDTATAADVIEKSKRTGYSRFPVVGKEGLDDIRGFVHLRKAVAIPFERRADVSITSSSIMFDTPVVPETMEMPELLVELRDTGLQMAVVVDEYGGTSGIVTLEDTVEEIVGNISDEHDRRNVNVRRTPDGGWIISGRLRPDEAFRACGVRIPEEGPYETVGGFIMTELDRIPEVGDAVDTDDATLTVRSMDGMRVDRVEVRINE